VRFFYLAWRLPIKGINVLKKIGEIIYKSKSDVITFNYDCLVGWAIELSSGRSKLEKEGEMFLNGVNTPPMVLNFL
jgi:hypothetical protein